MRTHSCEQCNRSSKFGGCSSQFSRRGAFLGRACMPRIRRTYRRCRQLLQSRYSSRHLDTWHLVVFWLVCLCFDHQVLVEQNHTARAAALCVELGNALRVKNILDPNTHSCVKKCVNLLEISALLGSCESLSESCGLPRRCKKTCVSLLKLVVNLQPPVKLLF